MFNKKRIARLLVSAIVGVDISDAQQAYPKTLIGYDVEIAVSEVFSENSLFVTTRIVAMHDQLQPVLFVEKRVFGL